MKEVVKTIKSDPNYYKQYLIQELLKMMETISPIILKTQMKKPYNISVITNFQITCLNSFENYIQGDLTSLKEIFPLIEKLEKLYLEEDTIAWRPETGKVCLTNLVGESTILQKKKLKQLISKQSEHIEKLKLKCLPESIAQKQLTIKFLKSILNCQQKYLE